MEGLAEGRYGYEENYKAVAILIDPLIEQGNHEAIQWKIRWLNGHYKGYIQLKKMCIEEANKGKRWACYLKTQGLKYGILGFEMDREAAIEYILANSIPY